MSERKVQEALRLLEEAGRLDLLQGGVGGSSRPPRRASAGVATAVLACSTARDGGRRQAVSMRGRVRGRAGGELASGRGRASETHRAAPLGSLRARGAAVCVRASSGGAAVAGAGGRCGRGLRARGPAGLLTARPAAVERRVGTTRGRLVAAAPRYRMAGTGIKVELGGTAPWRAPAPQDVSEGCANTGVLVGEAQAAGAHGGEYGSGEGGAGSFEGAGGAGGPENWEWSEGEEGGWGVEEDGITLCVLPPWRTYSRAVAQDSSFEWGEVGDPEDGWGRGVEEWEFGEFRDWEVWEGEGGEGR
ncbi:hypothetical protein NDU88_005486 [Pleurodeles waltl]|uniref:Uncharacterized protein n=1 Tax=Pleurodeles waltl TaxID=8319 RepID=A0AAV7X1C3_PLEWA|nr:hypothetical protein NDU88_005486 [Pleurodeles waltl]